MILSPREISYKNNALLPFKSVEIWTVFYMNLETYQTTMQFSIYLVQRLFDLEDESPYGAVWIGINDIETEGKFVYQCTGQEIPFTNWGSLEPSSGISEDCLD